MNKKRTDTQTHPQGSTRNRRAPLRQIAYAAFMAALERGTVKPGQMVSQRELCEHLEVPLAPLREALKRLEVENVVRLIPQRGVEIVHVDEQIIDEVYAIRRIIELEGLKAYARQTQNGQEAQEARAVALRDLITRTRDAVALDVNDAPASLDEARVLTELDHEMHRLFVSALHNRFATEVHRRALTQIRLVRFLNRIRRLSGPSALQEHVDVLETLAAGYIDEAGDRLEAHLEASRRRAKGSE